MLHTRPTYACIRYFVESLCTRILTGFGAGLCARDDAARSSLYARSINIIISRCGDIIRLRVNSCCPAS